VEQPRPSVEKIELKSAPETGSPSAQDIKPALKPPVLPDRLLREKEQETEKTAKLTAISETLSARPLVTSSSTVAAKTPEPEKLKSPFKTEDQPEAKVLPETIPVTAKSSDGKKLPDKTVAVAAAAALTPRAARARKRRRVSTIFFLILCAAFVPGLYYIGKYFCHETRIEGQVIPPRGTLLGDEAWIVTDFRDEVGSEVEELAGLRASAMQTIQENLDHVQRAQADIAKREERIRLLEAQIQTAKDEVDAVVKQAKDAAQQLWSGPGAQIDRDYDTREQQLSQTISDRAKALKLNYQPDPNFNSPEVWANAYRLALYQVPSGVDSAKELLWLDGQMKQWRDFTKSVDDRKEKIREQVAAIKQSPADKISDLQTQIDDLQHRIDSTASEEAPIKTELQQAQADLAQAQGKETALDPSYYSKIYSIPESTIIKRLPIAQNGRFHWRNVEKDTAFTAGETQSYWLFVRAVRSDGRQYWALGRITLGQDWTYQVVIEPEAFVSTKTILRPDLSPDEQQQ